MNENPERDHSRTVITGWVDYSIDKRLRMAADETNRRGYKSLFEEMLLWALVNETHGPGPGQSMLERHWPDGESLTFEQLRELVESKLPPVPAARLVPAEPVRVITEYFGPHADEINRLRDDEPT